MPINKLSGKVIPTDIPKYRDGLASGIAVLSTAGTAMYDALAANTIKSVVSPKEALIHKPNTSAMDA